MPIQTFEDLECWKACRKLRIFVVKQVVPALPKHEQYRLSDQMIRAARSTTANIAEGYGRFHYMDNAKFCSNSRGSCWETLDHLITAHDEDIISDDIYQHGRELCHHAIKLINGYMNYLYKQSKQKNTTVNEEIAEYGDDCYPLSVNRYQDAEDSYQLSVNSYQEKNQITDNSSQITDNQSPITDNSSLTIDNLKL